MISPKALFARARASRPALDHLVRAGSRYQTDTGDRLAAAVTFFGFLSFFPLLAVCASLLALVLGDSAVSTVVTQVNSYAPGLASQLGLETILRDNQKAGLTGLVGVVGLLYSGLGWVDALREALRTVWHQNVLAGNVVAKKVKDVVILAGLGVTVGLSVGISAAAGVLTGSALGLVGLRDSLLATVALKVLGTLLGLLTSIGLFLYLLVRLPKVPTPWRRVLKGAALAAVLFEVLKRVGALYIERTTSNPLYGTFAVAVGLLVWINLVSRMLLFCAAWTVTAPYRTDVAPSGTADPEQARKAGIPLEYADDDDGQKPAAVQVDGAPTPLVAALRGRRPPQDDPEGPPGDQESEPVAARRASDSRTGASRAGSVGVGPAGAGPAGAGPAGAGPAGAAASSTAPQRVSASSVPALPGQAATRRAAQFGVGVLGVGVTAVGVYAVRTIAGALRR